LPDDEGGREGCLPDFDEGKGGEGWSVGEMEYLKCLKYFEFIKLGLKFMSLFGV